MTMVGTCFTGSVVGADLYVFRWSLLKKGRRPVIQFMVSRGLKTDLTCSGEIQLLSVLRSGRYFSQGKRVC